LYGNAEGSSLEVSDIDENDIGQPYEGEFEGIVPMLKRWFSGSTSSEGLREWVEKFMELKICTTCEGAG
jgi:excinuclease ABC subunit A